MSKTVNKNLLALLMMVKNEEARITVSLDSMRDYTDTFIILDTGSTDKTIEIIRDYCKKNNITLHLKEEPFVNFEVSRNVSLDFADEVLPKDKPRFLLLLDCNDELQNASVLYDFVKNYDGEQTGFHLRQQWWNGTSSDTYYNMRMVKSHCGWRYKGVVHEYMRNIHDERAGVTKNTALRVQGPVLFQDRTKDDDKSAKRFSRDKPLLYNEYIKDSHEPRTLFYLGQTCGCLGNNQEAYKYYILRLKEGGFEEERYHSYYRLGELSRGLNHPWEESFNWYMKAFSHSQRVEPLLKVAEYYLTHNHMGEEKPDFLTAYMYAHMATKLIFPYNQILFIDRRAYDYLRWHLLGIVAYHIGRYSEGKEACLVALEAENKEVDMINLVKYLKKEREVIHLIENFNKNKTIDVGNMFANLINMSLNKNEIVPTTGDDIKTKAISRQEVLTKATVMLLDEIKGKK
jgi:glycosyltransferase involved in cell wall biosynthesis